ncbi:unnamed protein product [Acanthocheilonema viteae]|uniref:Apoptosis-antagonizing transcription factor C-terminal domain-containing protein n=1 Tax=Acanthocheilonema viteae TaxID=6277 RepID=A0A498SDV0_ACAVI|nr:unnamed protein product [Acanthocheilonema viteae]
MASVKQFIDSLGEQVDELPDIELADLAEDSKALWTRNKTAENGKADPIEFLKRRIIVTQELEGDRYEGQRVSSKNVFTGDDVSDIAHVRLNTSSGYNEDLVLSPWLFIRKYLFFVNDFYTKDLENEEDSNSIDGDNVADSSDQESCSANTSVESEERKDSEQFQSKRDDDATKGVTAISSDTQREKAESVRKQFVIWDRLMQLHIFSHAALRTFNQLPREQLAKKLQQLADSDTRKNCRIKVEDSEDEEIESSIDEEDGDAIESDVKDSGGESDVCSSYESITNGNEVVKRQILGRRKKLMPKELLKEYEKRHNRFAAFRSSTLSKWDDRTTLSTIDIMKNKKRDFSGFESLVLKQIEQIMSEKHRLLRRTQVKRHDVDRIGADENNNYDAEIFDDDDFYQRLLKELIERKSANVIDPVEMSRQWLEIQKLRQKRSKRKKVDTKASKGRKIRYVVIPKLVNFFPSMAEKATWSHEKRNQLFKTADTGLSVLTNVLS